MKGIVTTELFGPDGRLLKVVNQPSRSLVIGFMKNLYCQFAYTSWARQTVDNQEHHMKMAAVHGRGLNPWRYDSYRESFGLGYYLSRPEFIGECYGIQITTDNTAVTPADTYMINRIGQGYTKWRGVRPVASFRPHGICSDRYRYMWVADYGTSTIRRIWIYGGSVNSWAVAGGITGITYDGTDIWYAIPVATNRIYCCDAATGAAILDWAAPSTEPNGLAWDFTNSKLFSCDQDSDTIYRHTPATGAVEDSWASPSANPYGMEWREDRLWIVCSDRYLYRVNPATHVTERQIYLPPALGGVDNGPQIPWGICWDGMTWPLTDFTANSELWPMYFPDDETQIELLGMEVLYPTFVNPNGSMVVRRCFLNSSGGPVVIRKVGLHSGAAPVLIAADVLGAPITVNDGQVLRVSYTFQITV